MLSTHLATFLSFVQMQSTDILNEIYIFHTKIEAGVCYVQLSNLVLL
jgi:hypothetical protein